MDQAKTRVAGAFFLVFAVAAFLWTEYQVQTEGSYDVRLAFFSPFFAIVGLDLLIRAPKVPMQGMPTSAWLYLILGIAGGALNVYRYGAFAPGSVTGWLLLASFAVVAIFVAILQIRRKSVE